MTVVPAVTCFSRTTPASGARTGIDSPRLARRVLLVRHAEVLERLLGAPHLRPRLVQLLPRGHLVGLGALPLLERERLLLVEAPGPLGRLRRPRQLRLAAAPIGDGLAVVGPGVVDDRGC